MLRKMLLIAGAVAMPLGATAVTATVQSGPAGATPLAITCKVTSGTVNFAPPGISADGQFSTATTSTASTSKVKYNCTPPAGGTGKTSALSIVTANTQCNATINDEDVSGNPTPGCTPGMYNYDSLANFAESSPTLWSAIGTLSIKIGVTKYTANLTSSAIALSPTCATDEVGFTLKGKLALPVADAGQSMKFSVCLLGDTGPGTTGNFAADIGGSGITIATATIAPDSKAKIS